MKESVLYNIRCDECKERGKKAEYWGETGRDGYIRGGEHLKECEAQNEDNALWKHLQGDHRGENRGNEIFSMRIEKGFKKPLARQISEGVHIEMCEGTLLNSKSEWHNYKIPRIIVEEGEKQIEDLESGLGKKSESSKQKQRVEGRNRGRNDKRVVEGETEREEGQLESKRARVEKQETERKRKSREAESHRKEVSKVKRNRENKIIEKQKAEIKRVEGGKDYWRSQFQMIVEK